MSSRVLRASASGAEIASLLSRLGIRRSFCDALHRERKGGPALQPPFELRQARRRDMVDLARTLSFAVLPFAEDHLVVLQRIEHGVERPLFELQNLSHTPVHFPQDAVAVMRPVSQHRENHRRSVASDELPFVKHFAPWSSLL